MESVIDYEVLSKLMKDGWSYPIKGAGGGSGSSLGDLGYTVTKDPSTGIITCTYSDGTKIVTQKNDDGSITETTYVNDVVTKTVTTVKNSDGSITVTPITN